MKVVSSQWSVVGCLRKIICVSLILNFHFSIFTSAQAQTVKIIFAGDLMGHMPQHNAALQPDGSYDYEPCFRYIKDYVKSADLAILNLEVPLA